MPQTRNSNNEKRPRVTEEEYTLEGISDSEQESRPRPRKRTKTKAGGAQSRTKTAKRGKAGKLSKLPDMPLDVLFEIFGCLHPLDLLHLSRTTKSLRSVLLSRSARSVWLDSFSLIEDIPDCPEDMSEPAYARLAFENLCHSCCKSRATEPIWLWRLRLCKKCIVEVSIELCEIEMFQEYDDILDELDDYVPNLSYLIPVYRMPTGRRHERVTKFLTTDADRLLSDCTKYIQTGKSLEPLINKYTSALAALKSHAIECEEWEMSRLINKDEQREEVRESRRNAITEKIRALGWGDELDTYKIYYTGLYNLPAVKQPKPLTDRIWTNIKDSLLEYLQACKETRIREERANRSGYRYICVRKVFSSYIRTGQPNDIRPTAADICYLPEIKEIVLYAEDDAFEAFTKGLLSQIPALSERCLENREKLLRDLIAEELAVAEKSVEGNVSASDAHPDTAEIGSESTVSSLPSSGSQSSSTDLLKLATTWFKCASPSCNYSTMDHESVHSHSCLSAIRSSKHSEDVPFFKQMGVQPWNVDGDMLSYNTKVAEIARKLILACGLDPKVTTMEQMDALQPRFALLNQTGVEVTTWRRLINGMSSRYGTVSVNTKWRILEDNELPEFNIVGPKPSDQQWNCWHCWKSDTLLRWISKDVTMTKLREHLDTQHNVKNVTEDDYYLDLAAVRTTYLASFMRE